MHRVWSIVSVIETLPSISPIRELIAINKYYFIQRLHHKTFPVQDLRYKTISLQNICTGYDAGVSTSIENFWLLLSKLSYFSRVTLLYEVYKRN